jgi:cell division protein FtsW (lipid II flippase)
MVIWYTFFKVKGTRNRFLVLLGIVVLYILSQFSLDVFESGLKLESVLALITKSAPDQQSINMLITERSTALSNPFEEHSLLSRIALWKDLLVYSKDPVCFFLGRGVGALKADSLYFTYLAEFGYPGLIFIIVLLVNLTIRGFYVIDHYTDNDIIVLAKGITIMNITIAIISVTGTHIHYFPGDIYFWFFNGVLIQLYVLKKHESNITKEDVPNQTEE